jgi:hypothetical protein
MMAAGNEPGGKNQAKYLTDFVNYWKAKDKRRVYTGASVGMNWPLIPENEFMVKSGARGLSWLTTEPESISTYGAAIKEFNVPYISHEMGQWCAFPNFLEIKKYRGVYRARNLELFEEDLKDHGMLERAGDFLFSAGRLQALCYKAEIEKALRTPGLAGFQLLGLQDFPGQGTALVGVVDAFWDEKSYIQARQFNRFCNATVPLASFSKFVFTNNEMVEADVQLFHFGKIELKNVMVTWTLKNDQGALLQSGAFPVQSFSRGANQPVGQINVSLADISIASRLTLEVLIDKTPIANDWNIWVYPANLPEQKADNIYHCTTFDAKAEEILNNGGKVFLNAAGKVVKGKEIAMHFAPVFWNTSWFKMRPPHTTGLLISEKHPLFSDFPTASHSDYQWWGVIKNSQVMHLEDFPKGFTPLVQPIDTWFMNRKLAMILECKVGNGKLIISSADLSATSSHPSCRQLFFSITNYMGTTKFNPDQHVSAEMLKDLFRSPSRETWDSFTKESPDELQPLKK